MPTHKLFLSYKRGHPMTSVVDRMHRRIATQFDPQTLVDFFDRKSIEAGEEWEPAIDGFLAEATLFVAFISIDYWHSPQCMRELRIALQRYEREHTPRLLFVLADPLDPATLSLEPTDATARVDTGFAAAPADGDGQQVRRLQKIARFNFLGPYDRAGRLCRLKVERFATYDTQLNDMLTRVRELAGIR